jgi:hypothetical protein
MNNEQIQELEREAEHNNGRCSKCNQTIKIYRYKINKTHASFLKAMANAVRDTGENDVDISTIGIAYSTRTQVSKIRQHGLIARIKNAEGAQIPRRWLITHKGWEFLNGQPIPEKVVIYNNQVLGHDGANVSIYEVLKQRFDPQEPIYAETPVSEPEARIYSDVRQPKKQLEITAIYKGRKDYSTGYETGQKYELVLDRLQLGKPVKVLAPHAREYRDLAAFQKDWRAI